ncbi:S8 family serine peptidase [Rummeliibacillus sp. G93]|uniref:S8 family peptidase n=1 Tax=Rummeliibacillus sp. G93 TaxID=2939494 RepID=UPI00201C1C76|nr:S8 family serine peptidase [Rummeliibacillus sp. G93]UQW97810.1 S8 family serine peptidase [Rummeliibacillus sp. G93]
MKGYVLIIMPILCFFLFEMQFNAQAKDSERITDKIGNTIKIQSNLEQKLANSKKGKMKVIIQLDEKFKPEGQISKSQKNVQESSIQETQDTIVKDLDNQNVTGHISKYKTIPYMAMEVDAEGLQALAENPSVKSIMEDGVISKSDIKNTGELEDELSSKLFMTNSVMHSENAWSAGFTGEGETVAILDTGVDRAHPFLKNKVVYEACFSSNLNCNGKSTATGTGTANDTEGHGTHVAGIATGNTSWMSGVAKDSKIIAIKVLPDAGGKGNFSDLLNGLERIYLLRNQYDISAINLSLGGGQFYSTCDGSYSSIKSIVDNLKSAGIATIAASGNDSYKNALSAPACISSVVSVGSTNNYDDVSSFSNSASFLDLLAPGEYVYSSVPGGGYGYKSGTSMATPQVTGGFTLVRQKYPNSTVDQILSYMKVNGVRVTDWTNYISTPRLDFAWMKPNLVTLNQVQKPTWRGETIEWTSIPNASQYEVRLYKEDTVISTQRVSGSVHELDLFNEMDSNGTYTVTVQAIGDGVNYQDGPVSPESDINHIVRTLTKVEKPTWHGSTILWKKVANTSYYELQLYKDASLIAKKRVANSVDQYNFGDQMVKPGAYTVSVQAIGDTINYRDSLISSLSNVNKKLITLAKVQKPTWVGDTIHWKTSDSAKIVEVRLYRGSRLIYSKRAAAKEKKYNLSSKMRDPGEYTVTVKAIGDNKNYQTGAASDHSSKRITLKQVAKPTWSGTVIQWHTVAKSSKYELKLYRGNKLVYTKQVSPKVHKYSYTSKMKVHGKYSVTVQAIGNQKTYKNGPISHHSLEKGR